MYLDAVTIGEAGRSRRYEVAQQVWRGQRRLKVWPQVKWRQDHEWHQWRHGLVISEHDFFEIVLPAICQMYGLEVVGLEALQVGINEEEQRTGWQVPPKAYPCAGDEAFRKALVA